MILTIAYNVYVLIYLTVLTVAPKGFYFISSINSSDTDDQRAKLILP